MVRIPSGYRPVKDTERTPAAGARKVGPADPNEVLSVSIRLRRRTDAPPLPGFKEWSANRRGAIRFSRVEFAEKFGASRLDLDRVVEFGRANGLVLVESSAVRRTVVLSGTVAQMNRAFGVELGNYQSDIETYRGREGPVYVPVELADLVEGVFGLDNRRMARRADGGGSSAPPITPRQVASLYNFPLSVNAHGQTIALLEFSPAGYRAADIQKYFEDQGLAVPALFPVSVDGEQNSPGSVADGEVAMDIEVAGSVAQGANIAVYFAPQSECGWVDILTTAILESSLPSGWAAPSVISISWGWAESDWTKAGIEALSQTFQDAAMLGVTIFVATGDNGSECFIDDGQAHVNYPASDPWVTACGGTSVQAVSGSSFTETTWDASGGGISDIFPVPYWQLGAGIPVSVNDGHSGRGIPDIAGHAAGYMIRFQGSLQGPFPGTSETAPLYAGLVALINTVIGDSVGYLNPVLYNVAGTDVLRDIADHRSNAYNGAPGYTAVAGWDACTGLGSVSGVALLNAVETYLFSIMLPTLV
jgi:kumamolisin